MAENLLNRRNPVHNARLGGVNVKDFGVYGDGTTDDTAAIQSAINASYVEGGAVFFPPGTYLISDTIALQPKVILRGFSPWLCTIKMKSHTNKNLVDTGTNLSTDVGLEGLCLDGDVANQDDNGASDNGIGVWFQYVNRAFMRHCHIKNTKRSGVFVGSSTAANVSDSVWIESCQFTTCGTTVVQGTPSNQQDNNGVSVSNASNVWITDNHIYRAGGVGIDCEKNNASDTMKYLFICRNRIESISSTYAVAGIAVQGLSGGNASYVTIADNIVIGDTSHTKELCYFQYLDTLTFSGNVLSTCKEHAVDMQTVFRASITGNQFLGIGQGTNNTYSAVKTDSACSVLIASGNHSDKIGATNKPKYMFDLAGSAAYLVGNANYDPQTAPGYALGSSSLNRGMFGDVKSEAMGLSGTVSTATTGLKTVSVTHGMGMTPANVFLSLGTPSDTASRFGGVWVSSIGATTFTINVTVTTAGAGGSTVDCHWRAYA